MWEKLLVENHGGCHSRNFAKLEFWKVYPVNKLVLVKHNSIFGVGCYNRKNEFSLFTDILSLISFLKKSWGKKILGKFLFITSQSQSQKNNVRAKAGWSVLFRYFADIE